MKRWRIGLLGAVVSLLAIYFIIIQVDIGLLTESFRSARYGYVLLSGLLLVLALIPRALRWRTLLSGALPLWRAFHMMNVAYLVNGIVPLRMGELARMFLARRHDPPVPLLKSASTILVERLLDLLAVLVLLGVALAASPTLPQDYRTAASGSVVILLAGFSVLIFLASQRPLAQRMVTWVTGWVPLLAKWNLQDWLNHFLDGLTPLTKPRLLLQVLLWTAVGWGISVFAGYILMFAFFESGNLAATCLYIAAAAFAIAVPAVPGNLGTYEWAIMLALSALNYGDPTTATIVSFAVVVHAVNLLVHACTGAYGLLREGVSISQLSAGVQEMNQDYVEQRTKA
ncbi:MAG: flippase-like domain-containing protein [Anaerolineae bacterium]|nr:flippase-like domain-containing protein [Anaerolineae bacterium]